MTAAAPNGTFVSGRMNEYRLEVDLPKGAVIYAPFDGYFDIGGEVGSPVPIAFLYHGVTHPPTIDDVNNSMIFQLRGYLDMTAGDYGPLKKGDPIAVVTGRKIDGKSHTLEMEPYPNPVEYEYKEMESFFVRAGLIPVEVSTEDMTGYAPETMQGQYGRFLEAVHDFTGTLVPTNRLRFCQFRWPVWGVGLNLPEGAKIFAPFDGVLAISGSSTPDKPDVQSVVLFPSGSWTETGGRLPCVFVTGDFDLSVRGNRRVRKGELIGTINGNHLLKEFLAPEDDFNLHVTLETLADNDWLETLSFYLRTRLVVPPSPFRDKYLAAAEGAAQAGSGGAEVQQDLPPLQPPKPAPSVFESLYRSPLVTADVRESLAQRGEPLGYVYQDHDLNGAGYCAVVFRLPEGTPLRMPFDATPLQFFGLENAAGKDLKAWRCAIQGRDPREVSFCLIGVSFGGSLSMDEPVAGRTIVGTAGADLIGRFGEGEGNVVVILTSLYDRDAALAAFGGTAQPEVVPCPL